MKLFLLVLIGATSLGGESISQLNQRALEQESRDVQQRATTCMTQRCKILKAVREQIESAPPLATVVQGSPGRRPYLYPSGQRS